MSRKGSGEGFVALVFIVLGILVLGNIRGCGGVNRSANQRFWYHNWM